MENFDLTKQLQTIVRVAGFMQSGLFLLIVGTIVLAIYKKKKGGNYKLVVILGIAIVFLCLLVMSFVTNYLVSPIYNIGN